MSAHLAPVLVRPAHVRERPALERILLEATAALGYAPRVMQGVRRATSSDPALSSDALAAGRVLAAEAGGTLVGFGAVEAPTAGGRSELTGIFVVPRHWRRGIARMLVDAAATWAAARGGRVLWTIGSSPFYERTGWTKAAEVATPLGEPAWIVERPIALESVC